MPFPAPARDDSTLPVTDFGFGILDRRRPTQLPRGAALLSFDADYDSRNIGNRGGYKSVLENGPGAVKIANFESGEAWAGGSADVTNFVLVEAEANGAQGRSLSATGGGAEVAATLTVALNLGTGLLDVIHLWLKPTAKPATITGYTMTLRFQTSANNYFQKTIATHTDLENEFELNLPKYHRFLRQEFAATGAPDWTNITQIRLALIATGTGTLIVTADNLHRTPGLMQDLFQFRRQSGDFAGGASEYAVTNGVLYRNDGQRWTQVFTGFNPDVPVYSLTTQNRRILTDGVTTPRLMMDDGATVYRLGVLAPPKQIGTTIIPGGGLPDDDYYVQVLFYSSKTGTFSAPDDRLPASPLFTVTGGPKGVRFVNIPVSSDPQVDWVVIGVRPSIEPEAFFRITDGAFGDVPNGTTSIDFLGSLADLQARTATVIDPDMDYPTVIDPKTMQAVEAHPLFLAEAGGYIITVMAEQPTVARWSRFRHPGSWRLDDEQPLGENDSESISGLGVLLSTIFAFKRTAVYYGRVVGGDEGIRFETEISERGSVDHKSILKLGQQLFYRGQDGLYRLTMDMDPARITSEQQATWDELWSNHSDGWGASVVNRTRQQIVHFGRKMGSLRNDVGWVTQQRTVRSAGERASRWPDWGVTLHRLPADVAAEVRSSIGWEPWIGGKGQVWRLNHGTEDDGRPIETVHRTSLWSPNPHFVHRFKSLELEAQCSGNFDLEVRPYIGAAISPDGTAYADLQGNADVLGPFVLGTDILGEPQYVSQRLNLPTKVARYVSFELKFRGRAPLQIYRLSLISVPIGMNRTTM